MTFAMVSILTTQRNSSNPWGQWIDYTCRLGSFVFHPQFRGVATSGRSIGPSHSQAVGTFWGARCTSVHIFTLLFFPSYSLSSGRVDDLSFFEYLNPFCFLSIKFHCTMSIFYKILPYFVYHYCFMLGSHKLVFCFVYCLSQGISHWMSRCSSLGGGWMIFHFRVFKSILFFVN